MIKEEILLFLIFMKSVQKYVWKILHVSSIVAFSETVSQQGDLTTHINISFVPFSYKSKQTKHCLKVTSVLHKAKTLTKRHDYIRLCSANIIHVLAVNKNYNSLFIVHVHHVPGCALFVSYICCNNVIY